MDKQTSDAATCDSREVVHFADDAEATKILRENDFWFTLNWAADLIAANPEADSIPFGPVGLAMWRVYRNGEVTLESRIFLNLG